MPPNNPYNSMHASMGLIPPDQSPVQLPALPPAPHPGMVPQQLRLGAPPIMGMGMPSHMGGMSMTHPGMMSPLAGGVASPLGGQRAAARQHMVQNSPLPSLAAGVGTAARLGVDLAMPFGMGVAFEAMGGGQAIQNLASAPFKPLIQQQAQSFGLQAASLGHFRMGGGVSRSMGTGMSFAAANRVNTGLNALADSSTFQNSTDGMFNRADLQKITQLSGQLGFLNNAQDSRQMVDAVKNISKAVKTFMDVAGEPDFQEALRQMGQMRQMGMTLPQTNLAARNASMFARMAGVSTGEMLQTGMMGANASIRAGMTGAAGFNMGMAARGIAGVAETSLNTRQLALAGGASGITSDLMGMSMNTATIDALLPAMLTRGRGGGLTIDQGMMSRLASGDINIQQMMRQGAGNIRRLGGRDALEELFTRRTELQDEMMGSMGGTGAALMPLMIARGIMQNTGMGLGSALQTAGMSERQSRTMSVLAQDPEFWDGIRRSQRERRREMQRAAQEQRDTVADLGDQTGIGMRFRHVNRHISHRLNVLGEGVNGIFTGRGSDVNEVVESRGEGARLIRAAREDIGDTAVTRAARADFVRDRSRMDRFLSRGVNDGRSIDGEIARREDLGFGFGFLGPGGAGLTQTARGGEHLRETLARNSELGVSLFGTHFGLSINRFRGMSGEELVNQVREDQQFNDTRARARDTSREAVLRRRNDVLDVFRGAGGVSDERASQLRNQSINTASAAVSRLLESGGGLLGTTDDIDQSSIRAAAREALLQSGDMSEEQVDALINSDSFNQSVLRDVEQFGSRRARGVLEQVSTRGSEAAANLRAGRVDIVRQRNRQDRNDMFTDLGFDADNLTADQRRAISDLSSVGGREGDLNRRALMLKSLQARANNGDREAQAAAANLMRDLEEEFGDDPEMLQQAIRNVGAATSGIDEAVFDTAGFNLQQRGVNSGNVARRVRSGSQAAGEVTDQIIQRQLSLGASNLVGDNFEAVNRAAADGGGNLRTALQAQLNSSSTSEEQKRRIRNMLEVAGDDDERLNALYRRAIEASAAAASEGDIAVTGEGSHLLSALDEETLTDAQVSGLQEDLAAPGPGRRRQRTASRNPGENLNEASNNLNTAAAKLTTASESMTNALEGASLWSMLSGSGSDE